MSPATVLPTAPLGSCYVSPTTTWVDPPSTMAGFLLGRKIVNPHHHYQEVHSLSWPTVTSPLHGRMSVCVPGAPPRLNVTGTASLFGTSAHISVTNAAVSYDLSICPANSPATTGPGIVATATVTTTGNGRPAPFESQGASTMQVCITGGSTVSFSNITLVYKGPATGHFGPQAIHGVVSRVSTQ